MRSPRGERLLNNGITLSSSSGIPSLQIADLPCSLHARQRVVAGHASDGREETHCELVTPQLWTTFTVRRHVQNFKKTDG